VPESILRSAGLGRAEKELEVLAIRLPGSGGRSGDDLFGHRRWRVHREAIEAFGLTRPRGGTYWRRRRFCSPHRRNQELFSSLVVGAGASTVPLIVEAALKFDDRSASATAMNAAGHRRLPGGIRGYASGSFADDYLARMG